MSVAEIMREVEKRTIKEVVAVMLEVNSRLHDADGNAPGDVILDDEQIVRRWIDWEERSITIALPVVDQATYDRLFAEYQRAYLRLRGDEAA